jgi:hypothetical protein
MYNFHPLMKPPSFLLLIILLRQHYRSGRAIRNPVSVARITGALLFIALLSFGT